jgi:hypothetical protein
MEKTTREKKKINPLKNPTVPRQAYVLSRHNSRKV